MTTPTQISNMALDAVPSAQIVDLSEGTLQAKLCARHYPQVLGELLEMTDWGVGVTRTVLAETTNVREGEWAHAYARPGDAALIIALRSEPGVPYSTAPVSAYERPLIPDVPFADYGSILYSNMPMAQVDYIGTVAVAQMSHLMRRALAAMLAARIVLPLTKDEGKRRAREEEAANAIQAAAAANFNRQPQSYMDFVPDVLAARMGDG